jgi:hypothetical protein
MLSRIVGESFVFMKFQKGGDTLEVALLLEAALGLDFAEPIE